tara:strand:+ start:369 stop:566 length:198 start_codon:yes stop_codon:yes gene_type:complete
MVMEMTEQLEVDALRVLYDDAMCRANDSDLHTDKVLWVELACKYAERINAVPRVNLLGITALPTD